MQYRNMGRTGLQLSVLSFGSWVSFHKQIDDGIADELMGIAYDNGVNFFDNAEVYALGESEKMMGRVLKKKNWDRTSYTVSSKVFWGWRGKENKPNQHGLSRKHITEACHEALQRLQTDYLDLYFCHRPDKQTPIEETVWSMHQLILAGKILYWGTSEWSAQEIMEAHMVAQRYNLIGPVMEQPQYNMLVRDKVEVEYDQIYKTVGLGTTIWSPLASGYLTGKYLNQPPSESRLNRAELGWLSEKLLKENNRKIVGNLVEFAKEIGVSMPQFGVAWCLKNPNVSTVILGATKTEQLEETLKSTEILHKLTPDVMEHIETILQNKPQHPPY